jgi:hypothetical protein
LRRNGGNPDLLIEGEQEERDDLSGDSGVPLRHMGWKPMLHATYPVHPSSSTNSGIRKVDAEKYTNHKSMRQSLNFESVLAIGQILMIWQEEEIDLRIYTLNESVVVSGLLSGCYA